MCDLDGASDMSGCGEETKLRIERTICETEDVIEVGKDEFQRAGPDSNETWQYTQLNWLCQFGTTRSQAGECEREGRWAVDIGQWAGRHMSRQTDRQTGTEDVGASSPTKCASTQQGTTIG